jgi:hypothetical protein
MGRRVGVRPYAQAPTRSFLPIYEQANRIRGALRAFFWPGGLAHKR